MTLKRLETFVIVVIIALIGIVYAFTQKPALAPTNDQTQNQIAVGEPNPNQQVSTNVIEYQGQDGRNAMDLLKASHRVDVKSYSFGDLVTGIDGVTPDSKHFWAMYVNGQFSAVGASQYTTKSSDTIRWQMDEILTEPTF